MTTGISSTSTVGLAPTTNAAAATAPAATDAAAAGSGTLPTLGSGSAPGATLPTLGDPAAQTAPATDPGATPGATSAGGAVPSSPLLHARWLGPLSVLGGGGAVLHSFKPAALATAEAGVAETAARSGNKWMRIGGIAGVLGGLGLTALGFNASGSLKTAAQANAAMTQLQAQHEAELNQVVTEANTAITQLQAQGGGATSTSPTDAAGEPAAAGAGTASPDAATDAAIATTVVPGSNAGTAVSAPSTTAAGATAAAGAAWTVQSLVGRTVNLGAGTSPSGGTIAEAGTYTIEQLAGDPAGYRSVVEANAAARASMSTELMGSRFLRWLVVEHDGRFYGAIAKQSATGQTASLDAATGTVVAWSAMNHIDEQGQPGWMAYEWTQSGGAVATAVPYGTVQVFPSVAASTTSTSTAAAAPASAPVTGGGATPGSFDPSSPINSTIAINAAATDSGVAVAGGALQVQSLVPSSTGGFATMEEAAAAARSARAATPAAGQWARWITLEGTDGRYYAYQASIVSHATTPLATAAPVHVFAAGAAEYYDGAAAAWKAVADV